MDESPRANDSNLRNMRVIVGEVIPFRPIVDPMVSKVGEMADRIGEYAHER